MHVATPPLHCTRPTRHGAVGFVVHTVFATQVDASPLQLVRQNPSGQQVMASLHVPPVSHL
jgi:hypothetical protein